MDHKRPRSGRPGRLSHLPVACLILQIAVSVVVLDLSGRLDAEVVPDTNSYMRASRASTAKQALMQHRTYGYPLLLRSLRALPGEPPHLAAIPKIHAALFFAAALLFWFAVRAWSGSSWLALASATPLASAPVLSLIPRVQPDFAAAALALIAISTLLLLAQNPGRIALWILLTLVVFATYQVRPAYVFLIPLVPLIGWILRICREGRLKLAQARWAAGLALAMILPFLVFAGVRRAVVGHFGLVSFTGFNLIGIAASFIDEDMIETLPSENRQLAAVILGQRSAWGWQPMTLDGDTRIWQQQYNTNTWKVSINPARRIETRYAEQARLRGESRRFRDIEVNDTLLDLSRTAIQQRPLLYSKWVRDTFLMGIGQMAHLHWVRWPLLALLATLPIAWIGGWFGRALDLRLLGLLVLCGSYTAAHLLLVVAVSNALDRYVVGIALLLPSAICSLLFTLWKPLPTLVKNHG